MKKIIFMCVFTLTFNFVQAEFDDDINAMRLEMSAKMSAGRRISTVAPGDQVNKLRSKRGGPSAIENESPCGGISIGNINTSPTDKRKLSTTIIINGSIINTDNDC